MRLIENTQFDTIYHEHFSYLSLYTANKIFKEAGLRILNVEQIDTHGGSLRIYGCHKEDHRKTQKAVKLLLEREKLCGLQKLKTYKDFQLLANRVKNNLLNFLIKQKQNGKKVVGLGAAAKGNTLLNYAGIKSDLYHSYMMELKQNKIVLCLVVTFLFYQQNILIRKSQIIF